MVNAQARATSFRGVRRADAALGRPDALGTKLDLLEPINDLVEVKDDMRAVGHEQTAGAVKSWLRVRRLNGGPFVRDRTLSLKVIKLFEERRNVYNDASANQPRRSWVDES